MRLYRFADHGPAYSLDFWGRRGPIGVSADPFAAQYLRAWGPGEVRYPSQFPAWMHPSARALYPYARSVGGRRQGHGRALHYIRTDEAAPDPEQEARRSGQQDSFPFGVCGHFWLFTRSPAFQVALEVEGMSESERKASGTAACWIHSMCCTLSSQGRLAAIREDLLAAFTGARFRRRIPQWSLKAMTRMESLCALLLIRPEVANGIRFQEVAVGEQMASLAAATRRETGLRRTA